MRRLTWALLFPALLLGGCSTVKNMVGGNDGPELAELKPIGNAVPVASLWSHEVGEGAGKLRIKLVPAVAGDRVFAAGTDGRISAHQAASGAQLWAVELEQPVSGGPSAGDGLVLVGTSEGEVFALDAGSGEQRWRATVSSEVLAAPAVRSGVVAVRTIDGKLFGLDARTGKRLWIYDSTVPVLSLRGTSDPVIAGDLVLNGFDGGRMVALAVDDGRLEWERRVAVPQGRTELERLVDIDSRPEVVDDTVYVAAFQGRVAALDLVSGKVLWDREMSSHAGIAVDEAAVYVSDSQGFVWALDRFNGNSLWRQTELENRRLTAPARTGDYVAVGDFKGYVHWLRAADGSFAARTMVDGDGIAAAPLAYGNDTVFVYGNSGSLTALRLP